jgi:hypothetical protein
MQPLWEVADVLREHWPAVGNHSGINSWQMRILSALKNCRTAVLGGHVDACTSCGVIRISYNSCRNRHCPKCQGNKREEWIASRKTELLPVPYFHVVFTLPDTLNSLALYKPKEVYEVLFEAAWDTIHTFGKDPKHLGATTGMISILHTWGQTLSLHPHLHCIVPGGGLTRQAKWKTAKSKGKYLFPVKALSRVFRAKYVHLLKTKGVLVDRELLNQLFQKEWVVFAKRPFGNPQSVVEYLGRYTHKIALSNHRIQGMDQNSVTFSYKDYRHSAQKKEMTLETMEFIRRFSMHILPKGFVRIRHYGILSSSCKKEAIPLIKDQFPKERLLLAETRILETYNPKLCPHCKTETITTLEILPKRGPPAHSRLMETGRLIKK